MRFFLCTNARIEDVLIHEVTTALDAHGIPGVCKCSEIEGIVFVDADDSPVLRETLCLVRSCHYVAVLTSIVDLPQGESSLATLCQICKDDKLLPNIAGAKNFRVRSNRMGVHSFRSVDVERDIGEVIHEEQGVAGCMKNASVVVRADVVGSKVVFGEQIHNEELTKRLHPDFIRDASLRPNVAFAMLYFSKFGDGQVLVDPFVGSGTIVFEAALRYPNSKIIGVDRSERVVEGARANAESLSLQFVDLVAGNARTLHKYVERGTVDAIVTNPPWGIRIGKSDEVDELYKGFLVSAAEVLKIGGRVVILLVRWESFIKEVRCSGRWNVIMARPVRTGDLIPVLFVLERCDDPLWTQIKKEITTLVNESKIGDGSFEAPQPEVRKRRVSQ